MTWRLLRVAESAKKGKKLDAFFEDDRGRGKVVSFGAVGYEDYTTHHDKDRRERYRTRHAAREDWNDATSPGALSLWILWGPTTSVQKNVAAYRKRFWMDK